MGQPYLTNHGHGPAGRQAMAGFRVGRRKKAYHGTRSSLATLLFILQGSTGSGGRGKLDELQGVIRRAARGSKGGRTSSRLREGTDLSFPGGC